MTCKEIIQFLKEFDDYKTEFIPEWFKLTLFTRRNMPFEELRGYFKDPVGVQKVFVEHNAKMWKHIKDCKDPACIWQKQIHIAREKTPDNGE